MILLSTFLERRPPVRRVAVKRVFVPCRRPALRAPTMIFTAGVIDSILLAAIGATAKTTNDLSDAEIQGRNLAQQLCEAQPAENFTNTGVLQIRDGKGKTSKIPIKFETIVTTTNWSSIYELSPRDFVTNTPVPIKLVVLHGSSNSNQYRLTFYFGGNPERRWTKDRSDIVVIFSFAGDFCVADLGLEFFHWPEQKILKHEMRRGRACKVQIGR